MQETNVRKKPAKRVVRDRTKTLAVNYVAAQLQIAQNSVYAILRGDQKSPIEDEVKRAYEKKYSQLKQALEA